MPLLIDAAQRANCGTWIEIRLDRFRQNLNALKKVTGPAEVMAVVKANAYGHGLVEMARAIKDQVSYLGVSSLYEVLELKEHGIETPIFLFGRLFGQEIASAVKTGVTLTVSSFEEAQEISVAAGINGLRAKVHIKVDTGMGRLGISEAQALPTIEKIAALPALEVEGLYTHFPNSERGDGFMESQSERLGILIQELKMRGVYFKWHHAANSAGCLKLKNSFLNLVRPGLILYGILPGNFPELAGTFQPVLSLKSRIMLLKRMLPGDSVGYGRDFKVTEPTTIAALPVGYSHGYPFHLSGKSFALYRGKRFPIAGRVSMDFLCVNLGNTPAQVGDEVTLLGEDGRESITAAELAQSAGTIPYEIVTRLASRLPRFYQS